MRHLPLALLTTLGLLTAFAAPAWARIKLITLPVRERVEIQLDNPHATLVEEERIVPLVKGVNQVDFSWANTQIDPNTIVFRVVAPADGKRLDVKVLSVSYPPNEAALVWSVSSSDSGSARVRISYLLGNLTKSFAYRAVASTDEKSLTLTEYMRLQNFANEEFLAAADPTKGANLWAGFGRQFLKPVGLNETKEMMVEKFPQVPIRKTYTCNPAEFDYLDRPQNKLRVPMHYVLRNNQENNLGKAPLPFGKVRIFIAPKDGQDQKMGAAFLGEDWGKFTPLDDEMKLYLGVAQDISVKRTIEKNNAKRVAGNLYDYELIVKYEIENFKDQPVTLDVAESLRFLRREIGHETDANRDVQWELGRETTFEGGPDAEQTTFEQVLFHAQLPPRAADGKAEKVIHKLHVTLKNEW